MLTHVGLLACLFYVQWHELVLCFEKVVLKINRFFWTPLVFRAMFYEWNELLLIPDCLQFLSLFVRVLQGTFFYYS